MAAESAESVPIQVAADSDRRGGENRAADPEQGATDDQRHDDHRRVQVDGVAHHLRDQEVVLELLDADVENDGGEGRHREIERPIRIAGTAAIIGPMIGNHSSTPAIRAGPA